MMVLTLPSNRQEQQRCFLHRSGWFCFQRNNHAGGILGGMSDGSDIILRATIKPTPSISATQHTVNKSGEEIDINIKGRHDPIIVPRAVVVVESMAAITIVDAMFANMSARMDSLERFYK